MNQSPLPCNAVMATFNSERLQLLLNTVMPRQRWKRNPPLTLKPRPLYASSLRPNMHFSISSIGQVILQFHKQAPWSNWTTFVTHLVFAMTEDQKQIGLPQPLLWQMPKTSAAWNASLKWYIIITTRVRDNIRVVSLSACNILKPIYWYGPNTKNTTDWHDDATYTRQKDEARHAPPMV